jgi:hypothetical protein
MLSIAAKVWVTTNIGCCRSLQIRLAPSATQWSDPDMIRQFSTKSGAVAKFSWRES